MANSKANATGSHGIEETSLELLRNTPSNIRRLEDEIEQCQNRQKYLAQTTSSSDGGDVRWYFCKIPLAVNELAASVPGTEIVGKSDYFRFGMRDSLALEASFLQREEELLSLWWKEFAECSVGPSERRISVDPKLNIQTKLGSSEGDSSNESYAYDEERVGVPVKGGLYEVDLPKRQCFPVYWHGENRRVLRGHWFARKASLDWIPLREDVAEQLEFAYRCQVWHRRTFQPSGLFAARVDLQGSTPGLHALFTGEDDTWEAWLNADASGFSNIISLRGNGTKLRRGFSPSGSLKPTQDDLRQQKEEEMDDYCSQVPVRHLVFMVHGIGQRLEKANLVDDVGNFRHITSSLAERHLTSYQRDTQRVLFIPCQWRRGLKLRGESAVEKITLDGVHGLRMMLSATAHDVLYYMSPIYCQEIINSVSNQLNRLYAKFLKRNPGYDGKVSIYGHSLGSVLSYDILCHQDSLSSPLSMEYLYKEQGRNEDYQPQTDEPSLDRSSMDSNSENISSTENLKAMVLDEKNEDCFAVICNSHTSDLEKTSSVCHEKIHVSDQQIMEPKQSSDFSLDGDIGQQAVSDMLCQGNNFLVLSTLNSGIYDDLEKLQENTSEDTNEKDKLIKSRKEEVGWGIKDKLIKSLKEEVDSLKARIADLESRCEYNDRDRVKHQGGKELNTNNPEQSLSEDPLEQENSCSLTPQIKYTKLEFKVDTFFAVGSPLGVFLALRNIRIGIGKGQDYWQDERVSEEMPACQRMFNIFHPFDPVAYRVEPLVCKEYVSRRPVIIPYHRGGKRLHIGFQEFTEDLSARSQAIVDNLYSMRVKVLTACQSRKDDNLDESMENAPETEERSYGSIMMEKLTGGKEGRIDYVLQDKTFEYQYVSAIGAHTNYWRDCDTALFILKHLYRDIPEEPNSPDGESNSENQGGATRFVQSEATDDLPLTFSDRVHAKEFSRKLRKAMKKS